MTNEIWRFRPRSTAPRKAKASATKGEEANWTLAHALEMANKDFLAISRRYSDYVPIPKIFYETYSAEVPSVVTMKDKFGNKFYGKIDPHHSTRWVYLVTDAKIILWTYTYRQNAIVRLTYVSKGRFNLFVPDSTYYFSEHSPITGLLPFEYEGMEPDVWYDYVGMYNRDDDIGVVKKKKGNTRMRRKPLEIDFGPRFEEISSEYTSEEPCPSSSSSDEDDVGSTRFEE